MFLSLYFLVLCTYLCWFFALHFAEFTIWNVTCLTTWVPDYFFSLQQQMYELLPEQTSYNLYITSVLQYFFFMKDLFYKKKVANWAWVGLFSSTSWVVCLQFAKIHWRWFQSGKVNVPVYCWGGVVYLLFWGCEGASHTADGESKRCCSPHHHLTPSQRILATVTLLPHYLRQRSAELPSSITLFINQMADTSLDNTVHVTAHCHHRR